MPSKTWSNMTDPTWRGNSKAIKHLLPALCLISLACFAVSLSFCVDLLRWPLDTSVRRPYTRPSAAIVFFYTSSLPLATTLAALLSYLLHRINRLYPTLSIIWSIVVFGSWCYILIAWGTCEYSSDFGSGDICPRMYIYDEDAVGGGLYGYGGNGRYWARIVLGTLACVGSLVELGLACEAVERGRQVRLPVHTCKVCCGEEAEKEKERKGKRVMEESV
ncbi:unnamed protein product [Zymoseptoria tritici ST99CH_3D7]|uniref:MARVEL domain-containing protein n=3 Tax=Zymoseptoria tritici TaxID=1047171 RepID=A0A1X7RFN0_ZYMT9|nr:unnamed protein product [Zymoseptoria tritici ST99CH_3D7]